MVECVWNVMAHAQKPDFVFRRNGRVHLNRRGCQFSRLQAREVCASAVVMLDTPCSEVVWRLLATHSIRQFPLHFPSHASPCATTFELESTHKLDCVWNVMAHAQKPDFVILRNGRVHLNRWGASVQSTTGSQGVRISGSNAGYTMFRGSVKCTGYPLHSPISSSLSLPCVPVCHHISTGLYCIAACGVMDLTRLWYMYDLLLTLSVPQPTWCWVTEWLFHNWMEIMV